MASVLSWNSRRDLQARGKEFEDLLASTFGLGVNAVATAFKRAIPSLLQSPDRQLNRLTLYFLANLGLSIKSTPKDAGCVYSVSPYLIELSFFPYRSCAGGKPQPGPLTCQCSFTPKVRRLFLSLSFFAPTGISFVCQEAFRYSDLVSVFMEKTTVADLQASAWTVLASLAGCVPLLVECGSSYGRSVPCDC